MSILAGTPAIRPPKRSLAAPALLTAFVVAGLAAPSPSAAVPPISSFAIDPGGSIGMPTRDAVTVGGTIECAPGQSALILFLAEQRARSRQLAQSFGTATLLCTGGADHWEIVAPAHEHARPGRASLTATAVVGTAVRAISDEHFLLRPTR